MRGSASSSDDFVAPAQRQPWRTALALAAFVVLFSVVGWRLHELQIDRSDDLSAKALRQRTRSWTLAAPRGAILDVRGQPLAVSSAGWDVYADPDYMNDKLRATVELAAITGQDRKELRVHFQARTNGRLVAKDLDESQAEAVQALDLAGVHLRRSFKRRHPSGSLAPHVVGFVLADGRGGAGIEGRFEDLLSGSPGHERIMVDALGRPLMTFDTEYQAPVSGANVQLTIDAAVQREVETALAEAIEKHAPTSAAAIVIRPATGEVLAMASWPTFSVDDFSGADPSAFRNNVLAFVYESGSTMKPLIAGAAVADGQVRWDEKVFCENGRWTYRAGRARRTITDHSLKYGGHQWLTVSEGVAKSDNVLMAKLGIEMGPERLYEWVRHLGFGTVTGIDLAGENVGIMLPRHQWNHIGSCMSVPMGHEMAVTPLQMAMAHAAVANRGVWRSPKLIDRVFTVDPRTGVQTDLRRPKDQKERRVFEVEDALAIQDAMALVMTEGTGRRLQLDGYTSAGKTGTTEKLVTVGNRKVYASDRHIGSFVGWAPANRQQQAEVLALVAIDDPTKGGHYGSQTGGPVVQRILQFCLERYGVVPDVPEEDDGNSRNER